MSRLAGYSWCSLAMPVHAVKYHRPYATQLNLAYIPAPQAQFGHQASSRGLTLSFLKLSADCAAASEPTLPVADVPLPIICMLHDLIKLHLRLFLLQVLESVASVVAAPGPPAQKAGEVVQAVLGTIKDAGQVCCVLGLQLDCMRFVNRCLHCTSVKLGVCAVAHMRHVVLASPHPRSRLGYVTALHIC